MYQMIKGQRGLHLPRLSERWLGLNDRMGMVGGGCDAFVGNVHRFAAGWMARLSRWLGRFPLTLKTPNARNSGS